MAERVETMPASGRSGGKYPWDEWLDGTVWELAKGRDFTCSPNALAMTARSAASTRRIQVTAAIRGDRVYVQAERSES